MRVPAGAVDIVMVIRGLISARAGRGADGRLFVEPCQDWQRRNAKATTHTPLHLLALAPLLATRPYTHVLHQAFSFDNVCPLFYSSQLSTP